jgi:hypothetical protein
MPYSITTKDGITINNIPDGVPADSPELKARVAAIRAGQQQAPTESVLEAAGAPTPEEPPKMGFFEGIAESVTGRARTTPETQALPEWTGMPELNQMSVASFKSALGSLLSNPKETVQILQSNFPQLGVRQDAKGNYILKSSVDQKEYVIPPGFSMGDIPRAVGGLLAFTPAGRATTLAGAAGTAGLTQAAIEATQAATGGEISPTEIAVATATGPAGQIIQRVAPPVVQAVKKGVQRVTGRAPAPAPAAGAPGAPMGTAMAPEAPPAAPVAATMPEAAPTVPEAPAGPSKTASLFDDWVQKSRAQAPETKDVFSAISRRAQAAPDVDFELRMVKTSDAVPTQVGEDYLNASSMETAEKIAKSKSIQDIDRVEDVLPIRLDENMRIIDGNHRHAAAVLNKDEYIQALVPVGKGTGKVVNLESIKQGASVGAPKAPAAPVTAAAPAVAPVVAEITEEEVGNLVKKASGTGFGSAGARDRLADLAQVNVAAKEAADRLGIQLPADVFSDNPQVRAAAGLTRSVAGGDPEAAWRNTVSQAVDKADDAIKQFDATFVEGAVAPGVVSQKIKDTLTKTRSDLNTAAGKIYNSVDEKVPKTTVVDLPKLRETLDAVKAEVGDAGMSVAERNLSKMIEAGNVTYGRLKREKQLIGNAINKLESPYGSMAEADLKRLYAALADDQLTNVGNVGGETLRQELRAANLLYAKERALGKRIVNAFGQDIEGSVANKMRTAITSAAKGDTGEFNRLLKTVPDDLRKETLATALASVTRSARGAEKGGFGFSEFADLYPKLRANPPVFKTIVDTLGKDSADVLRDLFEVSKRVTEARANVLTTGKANQALLQGMQAESLIGKVMESTLAKGVVTGAAATGGPILAGAASVITSALTQGNKDALKSAGKLFADESFQSLAIEAATKGESAASLRRAALSPAFSKFADAVGLPKNVDARIQFLQSAIQAGQATQENK